MLQRRARRPVARPADRATQWPFPFAPARSSASSRIRASRSPSPRCCRHLQSREVTGARQRRRDRCRQAHAASRACPKRRSRRARRSGHRHRRRRHPPLRRAARGAARRAAAGHQPRPAGLSHRRDAAGHDRLASMPRSQGKLETRRAPAAARPPATRRRHASPKRSRSTMSCCRRSAPAACSISKRGERPLRQHARGRWHRRRQRHGLDGLCALVRRARSSSRTWMCWCSRRSARIRCPTGRSSCPARSEIEIRLLERPDTRAQVVCDGAVLGEI